MSEILDFVVLPTYDVKTMAIMDTSTYSTDPPSVTSNQLLISIPGFSPVTINPFALQTTTVVNSTTLGITTTGNEEALPDGLYCIRYSVDPVATAYVEKNIARVDRLQKKFAEAFMSLDMMVCDDALQKQAREELMSIYFFIQGAIASANNCASVEFTKLYQQANKMLTYFLSKDCNCSGLNYLMNCV